MKIHKLKTWPEYFDAVLSGKKTFELRRLDRDFQIGDHLLLREYDPQKRGFTGREQEVIVDYILKEGAFFGLTPGFCIMSICNLTPLYFGDQRLT